MPETKVPLSPALTEMDEPNAPMASSSSAVVLLAVPFESMSAVMPAMAGAFTAFRSRPASKRKVKLITGISSLARPRTFNPL